MQELTPLEETREGNRTVWTGTRRTYAIRIVATADVDNRIDVQAFVMTAEGPEQAAFGAFSVKTLAEAKARGTIRALLYMHEIDPATGVVLDDQSRGAAF